MGKNNSSEWRVCPLMCKINEILENRSIKISALLNCLELDGKPKKVFSASELTEIKEVSYSDKDSSIKEKGLRQSQEYMIKLVEMLRDDSKKRAYSEKRNKSNERKEFYTEDINYRYAVANTYIEQIKTFYNKDKTDNIGRPTWSFEGNTYPDIFIETDKYIIVAEGKWTEEKRTSSTIHFENRDQLIRHLQGAIEYRRKHQLKNKLIIGFYIVNMKDIEVKIYPTTVKAFKEIIDKEDIQMGDSDLLLDSFYGCTSWEKVETIFGLKFKDRQ